MFAFPIESDCKNSTPVWYQDNTLISSSYLKNEYDSSFHSLVAGGNKKRLLIGLWVIHTVLFPQPEIA